MATINFYDDLLDHYVLYENNYNRCKSMITSAFKYKYITEEEYKYLINKLNVKHEEMIEANK